MHPSKPSANHASQSAKQTRRPRPLRAPARQAHHTGLTGRHRLLLHARAQGRDEPRAPLFRGRSAVLQDPLMTQSRLSSSGTLVTPGEGADCSQHEASAQPFPVTLGPAPHSMSEVSPSLMNGDTEAQRMRAPNVGDSRGPLWPFRQGGMGEQRGGS